MTIYPSLNATVNESQLETGFGLVYEDMTIEDAYQGLTRMLKAKKFAGTRNKHLAYLAVISCEMANNSVIHKAQFAVDEIEKLVGRYQAISNTGEGVEPDYTEIDTEIAKSFFNLEYCASKSISADLNEDIQAYPDKYNLYLTAKDESVEIRVCGKVGWSDQCFPETAKLQFKLAESPNWSTFPPTEPENQALLAFAHFHVNHA